jgi:hypothetical protein
VTKNSITLEINVEWVSNTWLTSESVVVGLLKPNEKAIIKKADLAPARQVKQRSTIAFDNLDPGTTYLVYIKASQNGTDFLDVWGNIVAFVPHMVGGWIGADEWDYVGPLFQENESEGEVSNVDNPYEITTLSNDNPSTETINLDKLRNNASFMPVCSITNLAGCIGIGLYSLIFKPSSYLFAKTGQLLDFTVGYSVRDESYRSSFVVEGWKVIKDFCNMFFIFVLLYIAFGTILNLNGVKTKEMIINVVIIGLLINFSLFATQIIIDTSNIITRVFYNTNTIQVGPKINGEVQNETGKSGEIKLSEALVSKINPQNIIINATEVGSIQVKGIEENEEIKSGVSAGTFILVVILASVVNIVGLVVFLTCALLFITRVVGLWMAMIFAPLAFFSYIVPKMQDMEMIGWKKWWSDTISLAFMAPVFVFFIYLIIRFLETGLGLSDASSSWDVNKIDFILKTFVPFIFIMILLLKAKSLAVKMSGKMGEAVAKVGSAVAGVGLAAATGGAAMAMRGTIGRAGSAIANSERVKRWEKKGYLGAGTLRNIGKTAGKGSFDVRATKLGGMAAKGLGVENNIGKAKVGGFEKIKENKIEKRVKRAKELELGEGSIDKRKANELEAEIRQKKAEKATKLNGIEKEISILKEKMNNQKTAGLTAEAEKTYYELEAKNREKAVERGGSFSEVKDAAGNVKVAALTKTAGGIADLEDQLNLLNDTINAAEIKAMNTYAANIESMGNKTINFITSFGQHSGAGANIAADRIRKGVKIEDKTN